MIVTGLIIALLFNERKVVAEKEKLCYIFSTDRIDPWSPVERPRRDRRYWAHNVGRESKGRGIFLFGFPVTL